MICISLVNRSFSECLAIVRQEGLVEVRIDQLDLSLEEAGELIKASPTLIATCRRGRFPDQQRHTYLDRAVRSGAAYVDMDTETDESFRQELVSLAKGHNCRVIISYHNFEATPSLGELEATARQCIEKGGALAKIACMVRTVKDVITILSLYDLDLPLIALGMGEMGRITRIAAPLLGAEFTYASYEPGSEAAAGQLSVEDMKQIFSLLKQ
jgi:3-dehydroquinate dehydratase-1